MSLLFLVAVLLSAETASVTDGEAWNEGVGFYESGDVTNALRVLRPLMVSKSHGARAAEVVAKLEHERGNREEAAVAAQVALRAHPSDPKANRNFTRAVDGLLDARAKRHIDDVLKAARGKDPSALLKGAKDEARRVMEAAGSYRTNEAARAVALADSLSRRAEALADAWIPVREAIAQSVTNEEQAATILLQLEQAQAKTKKAAQELADLDGAAYETASDVEHAATRFYKQVVLPPAAMEEDWTCQSNAWQDVEAFNGRAWQQDALDYTRSFRAKFPAWARAYEQQAQSDTNKPPFAAEDQAKVAALATELEKLQLACCESVVASEQERSLGLIAQIRELLPKDKSGGGQQGQDSPSQSGRDPQAGEDDRAKPRDQGEQGLQDQTQDQDPRQPEEPEQDAEGRNGEEPQEDREVEDVLKKAQERNDEHEADKKARMRKAPLPPNERDW